MKIETLVEEILESLFDNNQSVRDFISVLISGAKSQAARVAKEADDYDMDDLRYWENVACEMEYMSPEKAAAQRQAIKNFLWAVDKGYYYITSAEELAGSAFTADLRKAVEDHNA